MMTPSINTQSTTDSEQEVLGILSNINAAVTNMRLYSSHHPHVNRYVEDAYLYLTRYLLKARELTLLFIKDELIFNRQPIRDKKGWISGILQNFHHHGIERITFKTGLEKKTFFRFITDLSDLETDCVRGGEFIRLGKVRISVNKEAVETTALTSEQSDRLASLDAVRDADLQGIKEMVHDISGSKKIDIRGIDQIINSFVRGLSIGLSPITMLAPLKTSDEYTFTHVINVCILTMSQAESLGFKGRHLYHIGVASMLHDTGKLFIPDEILNKPGALTADERRVIETHPLQGAKYIMGLDGIPKLAVLGALEHHIRFDGSGYPRLSNKWQPNMVSQLIAISDVFDAMRSRRAYKEPKPDEEIIAILEKEKGTTFNPFLVDNFLKLIRR